LTAVKESTTVEEDYGNFIKTFPSSITADQLSKKISEFAVANNVQILSFTPREKKADALKEIASAEIKISSDNYKDIVRFIKDIEDAPYIIIVEKLSGRLGGAAFGQSAQTEAQTKDFIEILMTIGAIKLRNE